MELDRLDRKQLIGKSLRNASYLVSEEDVDDFLSVVAQPVVLEDDVATELSDTREGCRIAPPSFAPLVAVISLLKTFDWEADFWFDYQSGTAMFGEQTIEHHRPLYVGEEVEVRAAVHDVYEKKGRHTFDVVEVNFVINGDWDGGCVMTGNQSYILFK